MITAASMPVIDVAGPPRFCSECNAIYRSDFERCPNDGGELVITSRDPLVGEVLGGSYVIEEAIGEGAMGRVYRAHHSRLPHRSYAVKVLLGDLSASHAMRVRFANEAENASRLDHDAIVRVVDVGETLAGLAYFVMELVEGETLGCVLRRAPMPPARVVAIARALCEGLAHAHDRGVVHRDFKPENVLLVGDQPRIVDFGLAISKATETRLTTTGVLCTPAYAAPEQLARARIDHRVDLYALGITMFEMVTGGITPFPLDQAEMVATKLRGGPAMLGRRVPRRLAAIIHRLLARRPCDRYQSAGEVIDALDALGGDAPWWPVALAPVIAAGIAVTWALGWL